MNIPTAEELYRDTKINSNLDLFSDDVPHLVKLMIEFAKLHVIAALKEASKEAYIEDFGSMQEGTTCVIDKDSILEAYPLTLIK